MPDVATWFALLLLVGQTYYRDTPGQPFSLVGIVGTLFIALSLTFEDFWQEITRINYRHFIRYNAEDDDLLISLQSRG